MISISCHSSINGHGSVLERSKTVPRGAQGGARMSTSEPPLAPRGAPRKPATGPNKVPIWLHDASRWRQYWPRCCPKTVPSSNTGLLLLLPLLMLLLMLFLLHPIPPPCEGGSSMGGGLEIPPCRNTLWGGSRKPYTRNFVGEGLLLEPLGSTPPIGEVQLVFSFGGGLESPSHTIDPGRDIWRPQTLLRDRPC